MLLQAINNGGQSAFPENSGQPELQVVVMVNSLRSSKHEKTKLPPALLHSTCPQQTLETATETFHAVDRAVSGQAPCTEHRASVALTPLKPLKPLKPLTPPQPPVMHHPSRPVASPMLQWALDTKPLPTPTASLPSAQPHPPRTPHSASHALLLIQGFP